MGIAKNFRARRRGDPTRQRSASNSQMAPSIRLTPRESAERSVRHISKRVARSGVASCSSTKACSRASSAATSIWRVNSLSQRLPDWGTAPGSASDKSWYALATKSTELKSARWAQEWRQDGGGREQSIRNAEFHYSLHPALFESMLGDTVGYSEGLWAPDTKTLNQAKFNNYEYVCRKLRLEPGMTVLEVGAGWGYMPIYMAKRYGMSTSPSIIPCGVRMTICASASAGMEWARRFDWSRATIATSSGRAGASTVSSPSASMSMLATG